jgi:hypothetical protein
MAQVEYAAPGDRLTFTAAAAISSATYAPMVELTGNRTVNVTGAASTKVVGVCINDPAINGPASVAVEGVWPCLAVGAIAAGDNLASAAGGGVAPIGAGTFGQLVGIALEAIANGQVGRVMLKIA